MPLLDLSAELLLCITSFLRQVDLLNLSLTCRRIHVVTEPESFRQYTNTKIRGRSFVPFIVKLLQRPELCKYVYRLNLKQWITLEDFNPVSSKNEELTRAEYVMLTEAAKTAGVITDVFPYESESYVLKETRRIKSRDDGSSDIWYTHVFDKNITFSDLSYDREFYQMLRAGIEDPLVILLVALLPNVRRIFLQGVSGHASMLNFRANHKYKALRHLTARAVDGEVTWPLAFFNSPFATSKLEVFEASCASSWYRVSGETRPRVGNLRPLCLRPGTLDIKWLELQFCCLKASDLQILLGACPKLKTFRYITGNKQIGLWNPSSAKMLELLKPFQETLEELWLELDAEKDEDMDYQKSSLITSLTHMRVLKCLSTNPEMWHAVDEVAYNKVEGKELPFERRLCLRLPPNLEQFRLQFSENEEQTSLAQLRDLIRNRSKVLSNLSYLHISAQERLYETRVEKMLKEESGYLIGCPQPFRITVGPGYIESVFDTIVDSVDQPDMRWFGDKYAKRRRKPNQTFNQVLQGLDNKFTSMDVEDNDI